MSVYRTFLFAPGNHPRRVEKALSLAADAVILDLEDACAISEKVATRAVVAEALKGTRQCLGYVRVNDITTEFCYGDLQAIVRQGTDGIVLPMVEEAHQLQKVDWLMGELEREHGLPVGGIDLIPIIETGRGLSNIDAIAQAGTRTSRLAFGAGDFTLDMGMEWSRNEDELLTYRNACVLASRAAGIEAPIDTVWARLDDADGFRASAELVKRIGFQGKMCIHPDQVTVVNEVFTPSVDEVDEARRIVAAFEEAERDGLASIQLDGKFIDYPIAYKAQRVLATMARIEARAKAE